MKKKNLNWTKCLLRWNWVPPNTFDTSWFHSNKWWLPCAC